MIYSRGADGVIDVGMPTRNVDGELTWRRLDGRCAPESGFPGRPWPAHVEYVYECPEYNCDLIFFNGMLVAHPGWCGGD